MKICNSGTSLLAYTMYEDSGMYNGIVREYGSSSNGSGITKRTESKDTVIYCIILMTPFFTIAHKKKQSNCQISVNSKCCYRIVVLDLPNSVTL